METPKPLLQGPKRHHFVPQWYQEGFVGADDCVAVYDRNFDTIRRQRPLNTAVTGHLYTLTDELGRKRFELEQVLSQVEWAAAEHWPALIGGSPISSEARGAIALFLGTLSARTPDFIQSIQAATSNVMGRLNQLIFCRPEQVAHQLQRLPEHANKSDAEIAQLAEEVVEFANGGNYVVETSHEWAMATALSIGEATAQTLVSRHWSVWRAPAGSAFVCSDSPVILTTLAPRPPSAFGVGFANSDALVLAPLNSEFAIAMHHDGGGMNHVDVDEQHVARLNHALAHSAQRYLFGRDSPQIDAIARGAQMAERQWQPKIGT